MPERDFVANVVAVLNSANRLLRAVESILIDLIAATAPWLAPVLPAYMVWYALTHRLNIPVPGWVALIGALVIEFLGLSAISTTLMLWTYNDRRRESAQDRVKKHGKRIKTPRVRGLAPVWLAAGSGAFYLVVVLVVNVVMDTSSIQERIAKAMLSSLSIIAGLILAVRAQHARRLEESETRRVQMRNLRERSREARKVSESFGKIDTGPRIFPNDWRKLSETQKRDLKDKDAGEIAALAGITERAALDWVKRIRSNGFHGEIG